MSKGTLWIGGIIIGAVIGIILIAIFAPVTGKEFRQRLEASMREALADARRASQARQAELEAELAQLQRS